MPSFTSLPLIDIVETLCLHCTPSSGPCHHVHVLCPENQPYEEHKYTAALASLCLTSRALNALCTPILYHRPSCRKWWLLARTLLVHDTLREGVKELCGCAWHVFEKSEDAGLYLTLSKLHEKAVAARSSDIPDEVGDDQELFDTAAPAMVVMAILCPNLEKLDCFIDFDDIFLPIPAGSLTNLTHVESAYADTEGGMSFDAIWPLAKAALNLHKLDCRAVSWCKPFTSVFESLTELRLTLSGMDAESLENILRNCPRLSIFEFEAGGLVVGEDQFTPLEAQHALRHVRSLKHLGLAFDEAFFETENDDMAIQSLRNLANLEHLSLDMRCLIPYRIGDGERYTPGPDGQLIPQDPSLDGGPQLDELLLVNMIPASLRALSIWQGYYGVSPDRLASALSMLESVALDGFPVLKSITISGRVVNTQLKSLAEIFKVKGISFEI